ncbi:MAG: SPOR domain-containing protein [Prevotella sp.]|nr:SPOR domain-containing protein [Prevotella sp.]
MIELQRHIEILLLNNDCVIIPGFGGFVAHHVEARYDEGDETFLPPIRTIGFNPQLKMNDSFLVQSYAEAYDISYPEALERIENEVNELRQCLEEEGSYELNNIGVLYLNEDGNYAFEPCEAGLLTPDLYGLGDFEMEPLNAVIQVPVKPVQPINRIEEKPAPAYTETPIEKEVTPVEQEISSTPEDDSQSKTIHIKVSLLRNLAAACIAVIAFVLYSTPLGSNHDAHILKGNIDATMLTKIMPREVTSGTVLNLKKEKAEAAAAKVRSEQAKELANKDNGKIAADDGPYYCIVLASRVTLSNAKDYVGKLQSKGYSDARVYRHKGLSTKVIYGRYSDEEKAYHELNRLNDREGFSDGWILKVKDEPSEVSED